MRCGSRSHILHSKFNFVAAMNGIFVQNLPPNASIEKVKEAFQKYGDITLVQMLNVFYNNQEYNLNSCYVYFLECTSVEYILNSSIDFVIDEYYLEVSSLTSEKIQNCGLVLGVPKDIDDTDLSESLFFNNSVNVVIERNDDDDLGYALLIFATNEENDFIQSCEHEFEINGYKMELRSFPKPVSNLNSIRLLDVKITEKDFSVLRNMKRYMDLTLHTLYGDFSVSSVVFASVSKVVNQMLKKKNPKHELDIKTYIKNADIDEFISAVYGAPIKITNKNAQFIHEIASELQIDSLILYSGKICYESLTLQNVKDICNDLYNRNINYDYVIEFLVTHFNEILSEYKSDFFCEFPQQVIKKIARSSPTTRLSEQRIEKLFENPISKGLLNKNSISNLENKSMDINENYWLLINSLDNIEPKKGKII